MSASVELRAFGALAALDALTRRAIVDRSSTTDGTVRERPASLIAQVRERGDGALFQFARDFARLPPTPLTSQWAEPAIDAILTGAPCIQESNCAADAVVAASACTFCSEANAPTNKSAAVDTCVLGITTAVANGADMNAVTTCVLRIRTATAAGATTAGLACVNGSICA